MDNVDCVDFLHCLCFFLFCSSRKCFMFLLPHICPHFFPHRRKHIKPLIFCRVVFQMAEELRTWITESMEKEEKRRLADEAREKRALAIANAPRRRSGRLIVSFLWSFFHALGYIFPCMQVV